MIATCEVCKDWGHEQDRIHGRGKRVHNQMKEATKSRCTVCGNIRSGKVELVAVATPKGKEEQ